MNAVLQYAVPMTAMFILGLGMVCLIIMGLGMYVFKDHAFERCIALFGQSTGVIMTGILSLHICDSDMPPCSRIFPSVTHCPPCYVAPCVYP